MIFPIHSSAANASRHAQKRHAAPQSQSHRAAAVKITKSVPAIILALLLAGSSTAVASNGGSSVLGAGALGQSSAVSRSDSRDSLLQEGSQLSVDGTFTTSVNEDNVIIEAPLSQSVQDARKTLQATIDSASSTLSSSEGKASDSSRSTLSGLIDQANSTVTDDNASTDSIYAVNSSLAEAANKVTSEVASANAAAAERAATSSRSAAGSSSAGTSTGTSTDTSSSTVTVSGSGSGQAVANLAIQYLGRPYVAGGNTPSGWDCSGYVQWLYAQFGVTLAHSSGAQAQAGTYIGNQSDLYTKAQPGDIIANSGHAAIYVGSGNCAQALNPSLGTRIYPCNVVSTFMSGYSIRRIFN
ncbi:C40 family peptidase [Pseudoscardovia suis]|uniref:Glycoside hydrolase n=1 Tax=Pseudoscardovia suis TaxID=987063 RepID=A0A261F220_9BIFI|nr:NlpC/P60 family protein [Pseudoscardovia suis]OZG52976.1 glycoside hydrolase [Pseudoscardovia suis]PJJ68482.1 cell wall-associated NlpC family hydrolase [Pseudoscardovia suis]